MFFLVEFTVMLWMLGCVRITKGTTITWKRRSKKSQTDDRLKTPQFLLPVLIRVVGSKEKRERAREREEIRSVYKGLPTVTADMGEEEEGNWPRPRKSGTRPQEIKDKTIKNKDIKGEGLTSESGQTSRTGHFGFGWTTTATMYSGYGGGFSEARLCPNIHRKLATSHSACSGYI